MDRKTSFRPPLEYPSEEEGGIERQTEMKAGTEKMEPSPPLSPWHLKV